MVLAKPIGGRWWKDWSCQAFHSLWWPKTVGWLSTLLSTSGLFGSWAMGKDKKRKKEKQQLYSRVPLFLHSVGTYRERKREGEATLLKD